MTDYVGSPPDGWVVIRRRGICKFFLAGLDSTVARFETWTLINEHTQTFEPQVVVFYYNIGTSIVCILAQLFGVPNEIFSKVTFWKKFECSVDKEQDYISPKRLSCSTHGFAGYLQLQCLSGL